MSVGSIDRRSPGRTPNRWDYRAVASGDHASGLGRGAGHRSTRAPWAPSVAGEASSAACSGPFMRESADLAARGDERLRGRHRVLSKAQPSAIHVAGGASSVRMTSASRPQVSADAVHRSALFSCPAEHLKGILDFGCAIAAPHERALMGLTGMGSRSSPAERPTRSGEPCIRVPVRIPGSCRIS